MKNKKRQMIFFKLSRLVSYLILYLLFVTSPSARADSAVNFGAFLGADVYVSSMTTDTSGNLYISGYHNSSVLPLDSFTLTAGIYAQDMFIAKLNSLGVVLWAKNYGGDGCGINAQSLTIDGSGNLYLAGYFQGANMTTPALTKIGNKDAFVIKFDSGGNTVWAKNYGGVGANMLAQSVAVDGSSNVYLGGNFDSASLTIPVVTKIGSQDAFAIKLDSSGNTVWAKNYGGSGAWAAGNSVSVDTSGNMYLAGNFKWASLTTPAIAKTGNQPGFVFKIDSNGNIVWMKNYSGATPFVYVQSVAVDASGNVYLGGYFNSGNISSPAITKIGQTDAFVMKLDSSGNTVWAKNYGGSGALVIGQSLSVDSSGNVYLGGYFYTASMTTPVVTKIGSQDAFAIKLDSSGNTAWAKNFGGSGAYVCGQIITVDSSGNVYLGGYFNATNMTTPALTKTGNKDAFLIKLDASGNTLISKSFGGFVAQGSIFLNAIAKDKFGNSYLAGRLSAAKAVFGSFNINVIGGNDAFIAKLDSFGSVIWVKNYGGAGASVFAQSVAVDGSGNAYLGGYLGSANLTTPALTKIGSQDAFVMKVDSSGNTIWAKNYGGVGAVASAQSVAVDSSGNVYLAGSFDSASMTSPVMSIIGSSDAFVMKLDSNGNAVWYKNYGGSGGAYVYIQSVAVDGSSNVYIAGIFSSANLTSPVLTTIGAQDAFVMKLDSSGNTAWAKNYGGGAVITTVNSVVLDGNSHVYLAGYFQGANMTTPALTKIGSKDAIVIKLDSSGNTVWSKNYGGLGAQVYGQSMAVDSSNNVYLAGHFSGANLTIPALAKIGSQDAFMIKIDSGGNTLLSRNYGGFGAYVNGRTVAVDSSSNVYLGGYFDSNLTTPALTKIGNQDAMIITIQQFNTSCSSAGKFKFDNANKVMVFCDGSSWQSMNNSPTSTCTGTSKGKLQYYSNGVSSDFVWYGDTCRSAKSTTTYGACGVNGKIEWDVSHNTTRGCINGIWTSLKGW